MASDKFDFNLPVDNNREKRGCPLLIAWRQSHRDFIIFGNAHKEKSSNNLWSFTNATPIRLSLIKQATMCYIDADLIILRTYSRA